MKKTGHVLSPLLKNLGIEQDVRLIKIRNDWQQIFDSQISSHMMPSRLTEDELLLTVDSPAWMQQLSFFKNEIIHKLSPYGIKDIRFRLGRINITKKSKPQKKESSGLSPEDSFFISEVVSKISDEELKETISRTIEKSFRLSKHHKQ